MFANLRLLFEHTVLQSMFIGEWEIGAFDGSLKGRGMSIQYTVLTCEREDLLVDREIDEDDISDYIDDLLLSPRGMRPQNHTVLLRVCKKVPVNNGTQSVNTSALNATDDKRCYLKKVVLTPPGGKDANVTSGDIIPEDVLEELEIDGEVTAADNGTGRGGERAVRGRRQAEGNWTDVITHSGEEEEGVELQGQRAQNRTNGTIITGKNGTKGELEESNEISLNGNPANPKVEPVTSEEMVPNHIPSEVEKLKPLQQQSYNSTGNMLSIDYDDYDQEVPFLTSVSQRRHHLMRSKP